MPATYWPPEIEADFIRDYLGPLLRQKNDPAQIWLLDHNYDLWKRVRWQLRDPELRRYVSGVAWHGYVGTPDMMSRLHDTEPDLPFFWTEGGPRYHRPSLLLRLDPLGNRLHSSDQQLVPLPDHLESHARPPMANPISAPSPAAASSPLNPMAASSTAASTGPFATFRSTCTAAQSASAATPTPPSSRTSAFAIPTVPTFSSSPIPVRNASSPFSLEPPKPIFTLTGTPSRRSPGDPLPRRLSPLGPARRQPRLPSPQAERELDIFHDGGTC